MKCILRNYGLRMTLEERQVARATATDMVRARGTAIRPLPPRDIFAQSGPRGILLNWRQASKTNPDIAGFRVYKGDENSLFAELRDPSATQHFIEASAGASPPVTNLFVSAINKLGQESTKVQIQATATVEAVAPTMPSTPPSYTLPYTQVRASRTVVNTQFT